MTDILLTHAFFLSDDAVEQRIMKPYPPLGILSLHAWLKQEGFSPAVFDSTFETMDAFTQTLAKVHPPVVGIYINMVTKFSAIRMIRIAKEHGARVVLGGPEPVHYAKEFLAEGADAIVIGEGERTLQELLLCWQQGNEPETVPGIVYTRNGRIQRTLPREKIRSLDILPIPDRDAIPLHRYMDSWKTVHGYSSLSLVTMRGCPYTCTWCSHAVYGDSYRRRSPRLVADEIQQIMERYAPDMLWFADDVFTIHHRWLRDLAAELTQRAIRMRFECITRADRLNNEIISLLADMGCARIWIGAESGSQRILDAMRRGVRIEQVEQMTQTCRAAGIETGTFIMLGYTGETKHDIEQTVQYLRRAQPDIVLTTVSYPIKGTAYYQSLDSAMHIPRTPFHTWNDRDIAIEGRYSKRFYRYASRRIINETAAARLWNGVRSPWRRFLPSYFKAKVAYMAMKILS